MGNDQNIETIKMADAPKSNNFDFIDLYEKIHGYPSTDKHGIDGMLMKGILPDLEIAEMSTEFRTGKLASSRELTEAGVKSRHSVQKDGAQTTTTDYGNGVVISSTEGGKPTDLGNGQRLTFKNNMSIDVLHPNHAKLNGDVVDSKGKIVAKHNDDGSYTVDTGKGFFTQRSDGTIRKETAIRSRDSKSFTVIDDESPLGGLRPSDTTKHK